MKRNSILPAIIVATSIIQNGAPIVVNANPTDIPERTQKAIELSTPRGYDLNDYDFKDFQPQKKAEEIVLKDSPKSEDIEQELETSTGTALKSGPSELYPKIMFLKRGTKVNLISLEDDNWSKVEFNGKVGYINNDFLKESSGYSRSYRLVTTNQIKFRLKPAKKSKIMRTLPSGTEIAYIKKHNAAWFKIQVNNLAGYISTKDYQTSISKIKLE